MPPVHPQSTMQEVLAAYPGAQRALFKRYHIGGCSSCAFRPDETLADLCARNGHLDPLAVLESLKTAHEEDEKMMISPRELADLRARGETVRLLDIRTREEWDAVRLEGATRMSQETMKEILGHWPREALLVIYDHTGRTALDAAAFFLGHGFTRVRCLRGGIDAWAREVDSKLPRYRLEGAPAAAASPA
ncbi:MAG TPA: rhodanese-like domain-containing protein [Methylomirabilota bacterium]|nr:rhodanese-like domain-containing protein [Methylomirabilota bacterium]